MKNFRIIAHEKLNDTSKYQLIEEGIYNELNAKRDYATHRIAMAMQPEDGEDSQYPLEDILDKFFVHVEEFLESEDEKTAKYILGGDLENVQELKTIIGKRAYNKDFVDDKGRVRVKLTIE